MNVSQIPHSSGSLNSPVDFRKTSVKRSIYPSSNPKSPKNKKIEQILSEHNLSPVSLPKVKRRLIAAEYTNDQDFFLSTKRELFGFSGINNTASPIFPLISEKKIRLFTEFDEEGDSTVSLNPTIRRLFHDLDEMTNFDSSTHNQDFSIPLSLSVTKKRPLEDFAENRFADYSMDYTPVKKSGPPPTPFKKRRVRLHEPAQNALQACTEHVHGYRSKENGGVGFTLDQFLGQGDFSETYTIRCKDRLFPNYKNEDLVFKRFQRRIIEKEGNGIEVYQQNMKKNYERLLEINFPVAEWLNVDTHTVDGYRLMKKVHKPFKITWDADTKLSTLDGNAINYLRQIKAMFQLAFDSEVCVDLKADNVGISDKVKYIIDEVVDENIEELNFVKVSEEVVECFDFMENEEEFAMILPARLKTFTNGCQEVLDFITPVGYVEPNESNNWGLPLDTIMQ